MKRIIYFLVLLTICVACQDDESFSTNTGLRLEFPADTLQFDTVFSQTPSSTYTFWIHNRNNDGIRLESVRLRRGNQSGFRINVDGIYLDNSNGSQTNDVEIAKKDSILVFVELTAPETRQLDPVLVEDDLIFTLESGVQQKLCLQAWSWDAQKWFSPVIAMDTVVSSRVPILIYGDLTVNEGVTLTIRNTSLYFHDGAGLEVYGNLQTENCLLRGDRLDRMFSYLPYDHISGQWKGIHLYPSSTSNELIRTEIRNPQYGVICDSAALDTTQCRLRMEECIVHNCAGNGVEAANSYIRLENCQLTNTLGHCLSVSGGIGEISYCTLAQFYPFSADRGAALHFSNRLTPLLRFLLEGSIVTGYEDDVMAGERNDQLAFEYAFSNSLLRTPQSGLDSLRCQQIIWETPEDSIQGKQHFVIIDEDNLVYDFHLDTLSTAKGLGCYR